jgi:hypothetical protein
MLCFEENQIIFMHNEQYYERFDYTDYTFLSSLSRGERSERFERRNEGSRDSGDSRDRSGNSQIKGVIFTNNFSSIRCSDREVGIDERKSGINRVSNDESTEECRISRSKVEDRSRQPRETEGRTSREFRSSENSDSESAKSGDIPWSDESKISSGCRAPLRHQEKEKMVEKVNFPPCVLVQIKKKQTRSSKYPSISSKEVFDLSTSGGSAERGKYMAQASFFAYIPSKGSFKPYLRG